MFTERPLWEYRGDWYRVLLSGAFSPAARWIVKSDLTLLDSSTTGSKLDPGGGSTWALGWGTETLQGKRNSGWFWKDKQESSRPQREESFQAWGRACAWSSLELGRDEERWEAREGVGCNRGCFCSVVRKKKCELNRDLDCQPEELGFAEGQRG